MKRRDNIIFPLLNINYSSNPNEFIASWKVFYNYQDSEIYDKLITKEHLQVEDLYELFKWKNNNMDFTKNINKSKIFNEKIKVHFHLINQLRRKEKKFDDYKEAFNQISTIWKIFIYHIIKPRFYPIFDQHVYRAYAFISKAERTELPISNKEKFKIYEEEYLPFFHEFGGLEKDIDHVAKYNNFDIDKALWAFGRAIKQYPFLFEN